MEGTRTRLLDVALIVRAPRGLRVRNRIPCCRSAQWERVSSRRSGPGEDRRDGPSSSNAACACKMSFAVKSSSLEGTPSRVGENRSESRDSIAVMWVKGDRRVRAFETRWSVVRSRRARPF